MALISVPVLVGGIVGWTILTGILNRTLGKAGREELQRTEAAIARAEAPKALLSPLIQEGVVSEREARLEERYGVSPQELMTTVARTRAGAFDQALPRAEAGYSPLVEQIAARMGMRPQDIASRLNPARVGGGMTLGKAVFGDRPV